AAKTCNKLIILVMENYGKKFNFSSEQRLELVQIALNELQIADCQIEVKISDKLLIDEYIALNADFVVRGIRNTADLEYEMTYENINKNLYLTKSATKSFEVMYLLASANLTHISSTSVRQLLTNEQNFANYAQVWLADVVAQKIKEYFNHVN
ncbi:hypothetical protein CJP74_07920, partial [Psittacicella melopsittaci]